MEIINDKRKLLGRAALPRRPELGRSSSFALPDYQIYGLEEIRGEERRA
jgi:hypothetical protein